MNQRRPISANVSPRIRAMIERGRKHMDELHAIVDEQKEDFAKLKKEDPLQGIMGHVLLQDREAVRATDEFSREVTAEDELLKKEEARWAEEDGKVGLK